MPYSIFSTEFGSCAIAWNHAALTGFSLPEENETLLDVKMARHHGGKTADIAMPAKVRGVIARAQKHFSGQLQDFADCDFDWPKVSEFQQAVYRRTLAIKPGYKKSYGEIARELSLGPEAARAVGVALGSNPWPLLVPCHRVVSASDKMTGFSAPGGIRTKTRLLALEGAELISE